MTSKIANTKNATVDTYFFKITQELKSAITPIYISFIITEDTMIFHQSQRLHSQQASIFKHLLRFQISSETHIYDQLLKMPKKIDSFFDPRMVPCEMVHLLKSQIRPKMEYCSHTRFGGCQILSFKPWNRSFGLSVLEEIRSFSIHQPLSHRRNVRSSSICFHGKSSYEVHSWFRSFRYLYPGDSMRHARNRIIPNSTVFEF